MNPDLRELERKGRRVGGMFLIMIGSGIVLESEALWGGLAVLLGGLAVYLWGFVAKGPADVLPREAREEP